MKASQQRQIDRFRKALAFGNGFQNDFTQKSKARELFEQLISVTEDIDNIKNRKPGRGGPRGGASPKQKLLNTLREDLVQISRTARLIEQHNPAFAGKFQVPDKRRKEGLANAVRQFMQDAEPVKNEFIAYEMPKNFLKTLADDLAAYENSEKKQARPAPNRSTSNADLTDAVNRGVEILDTLDVIINNKYRGQEETLNDWNSASKLEIQRRRPRRKKDNGEG